MYTNMEYLVGKPLKKNKTLQRGNTNISKQKSDFEGKWL